MKKLQEYKEFRNVIRRFVNESLKLPPKTVRIGIRYEDEDFIYYIVTYKKHRFIAPKEFILGNLKDGLTNLPIIEKAFEFLKPDKVDIHIYQNLFEIYINDVYQQTTSIDEYKNTIQKYWFEEYTNYHRNKVLKKITDGPPIILPDGEDAQ